jgi:hypothetical protein
MAKPPIQVHVSSSDFKSLLDVQKVSLENISSMKQMMEKMQVLNTEGSSDSAKVELETLKIKRELITTYKDELKTTKELNKIRDEEADAIASIAKGMKTFKTMGEKFSDFTKKLKDSMSPTGMKVGLMKKMNVAGIFDKSIEREKFIKTQQTLGSKNEDGSDKTRDQLKDDFKGAQAAKKKIDKTEAAIKTFKENAGGLSDSEFSKTVEGKRLLAEKSKGSEEYAKFDVRSSLSRQDDESKAPMTALKVNASGQDDESKAPMTALKVNAFDVQKSPTQKHADSGADEEVQIENQKEVTKQTKLLEAIAENTGGTKQDTTKVKPTEGGKEGGLLSGLMSGAGKALDGMKKFGIGLLAISAALWVAAKAFKEFGEVDWESIGKGMVALGGLVLAAIGLDKVKGSIIKGAAVLGVLALAMYGMSEALNGFADLDWETIGKGMLAVAGIAVIAAVMGAAIKPIALGAAAIGLLGGALWIVGEAMQAVGEGFSQMTEGLTKLGQLDGSNLIMVGAGLASIGAGMAVFGAGAAAAGIGNLVGGFLNLVTPGKSPVEQIMMMGERGQDIKAAGDGVMALATGLGKFSGIDTKTIKAIADLPIDKIAAMGAAMRPSNAVEGGSKANADESAKVDSSKGGSTAIVNAPVNNTTRQTQIIKPQIRNQESTQSRYINSRYGII